MFMDNPITPTRVEIVMDALRSAHDRSMKLDALKQILQPKGLPGLSPASAQGRDAIAALRDLDLAEETGGGEIRLTIGGRDDRATREILIDALDKKVLASEAVEPWFALFYAYLLGQDDGVAEPGPSAGKKWEERFNKDLFGDERVTNRFNASKYQGFRRWLRYLGLGWHDSADVFQPNPAFRLVRRLDEIFGAEKFLDSDAFIARLGKACPELDGGILFRRANKNYDSESKTCTLALSHALIDLHEDGIIQLECPVDSAGWSIAHANPPRDEKLRSDRIDRIRLPVRKAKLRTP